ncbi:MAG TPA: type I glyceraldehyde-3-phosphate dehydrogenase, partial [SAR202 cluster bacterium]|nr:type I glyceraldehyde-3-phosphate dehydrogenase [SAR202 cluster bacterium]
VDIVIECTGKFTDSAKASGHLEGGAKKVIITAPAKNEDITIVLGVNEHQYDKTNHHIISNASCTTNCAAPLMKVLDDSFGIEQGMMTTIHSYTNDQQVLDKRHKDKRRARAAAMNIIPTTTGAAKAVGQVIPNLEGKVHGMAFRVPTATVSVTDFVATLKTRATAEEINLAYQEVSQNRLNGILEYSNEPLVSSDYRESKYSCTIDGLSTITLDTNMAKVVGWYDNEWGYSCRTVELAKLVAEAGF